MRFPQGVDRLHRARRRVREFWDHWFPRVLRWGTGALGLGLTGAALGGLALSVLRHPLGLSLFGCIVAIAAALGIAVLLLAFCLGLAHGLFFLAIGLLTPPNRR